MAIYDPYAPSEPPPPPPPPPDDGWTYPGGSSTTPPPAWPYYWDPSPPSSLRRRSLAAIVAMILAIALIGAGVGVAVSRLTSGVSSKLSDPVVDVTVSLGNGDAAAGTGIVLTSSGEVLTNNHVVESAQDITVSLGGGGSYTGTVVGVDPTDDVAVVQLDHASGLPTASLGDSSKVQVGDSVTAVGNALGRGGPPQAAQGHITALGQTITATDDAGNNAETLNNMIQFDATIQPGDSGGPLYNSAGQVVGMDTAGSGHVGRRAVGSNQGFAIPINSAVTIARQIASGASSPNIIRGHRGILGVEVQDSTNPPGALVISAQPNSPADNAGIGANDVIVAANGQTVDSVSALRQALQNRNPGDSVSVSWIDSNGQHHSATLQLISGPVP